MGSSGGSTSTSSSPYKGYVVNFGARDGKGTHGNTDPTYDLFASGRYAGLCVEGSSDFMPQLRKNMGPFGSKVVALKHAFIYPHNAVALIKDSISIGGGVGNYESILKGQFNNKIHVFKIDIDSWDCEVIPRVVDEFQPVLVVAEYNVKFPPPLLLKMELNETGFDFMKRGHFYQCSLTWMLEKVMMPRGYMLLEIDWQNAMFVKREVGVKMGVVQAGEQEGTNQAQASLYRWLQRLYARSYRLREGREKDFPFNKDIDFLLEPKENGERVRGLLDWLVSGKGCVKQDPSNVGMVVGCGEVTARVRPKRCN